MFIHPLNCFRIVFFLCFDAVLEMIFVFVACSCGPCAVVAVVRSSGMVVVCLSRWCAESRLRACWNGSRRGRVRQV